MCPASAPRPCIDGGRAPLATTTTATSIKNTSSYSTRCSPATSRRQQTCSRDTSSERATRCAAPLPTCRPHRRRRRPDRPARSTGRVPARGLRPRPRPQPRRYDHSARRHQSGSGDWRVQGHHGGCSNHHRPHASPACSAAPAGWPRFPGAGRPKRRAPRWRPPAPQKPVTSREDPPGERPADAAKPAESELSQPH
jgi:hypothetical protein